MIDSSILVIGVTAVNIVVQFASPNNRQTNEKKNDNRKTMSVKSRFFFLAATAKKIGTASDDSEKMFTHDSARNIDQIRGPNKPWFQYRTI